MKIEKRHKQCRFCGIEFCDITKRCLSQCCSKEHSIACGVITRHKNGSYANTSEQVNKRNSTIRSRYGSFAACQTVESRARQSARLKLSWQTGEMKQKTQLTSKAKYGVEHWTKTEQARAWMSSHQSGKTMSKEARQKMSVAASKRLRTRRETLYTSAKGGFREDLGCYFRSNWEANFARILNLQGKTWEYEPKTFQVAETTYTPDFMIEGEGFVELKGRLDNSFCTKIELFRQIYPNIPIKIIGPVEYCELRAQFQSLIAWEGK